MNDLFNLTGKVALVTGAGAGLGAAFAETLAEAGASVVCADINGAHAERTVADLTAQLRMALQLIADLSADRKMDIDRFRRIVACDSLVSAKRIARNRIEALI